MAVTRMVRLSLVLAAGALAVVWQSSASAAQAQNRQLKLVSTAWSPFTNAPGQPRFALDLVESALGRINITATTTIVEASRFTPSLLGSDFDGSAAAWKDAEREKALIFSQPYLENRLILVGRRGSDVSAASLAALNGKKVAIVDGYSYGDIDNSGPTFVRSRGEEDSVSLLLGSAVDYALMDDLVVEYIAKNNPEEARARLQFGTRPLVTRPLYLALSRRMLDAQGIVNRFNAELRGMIADRTYHRLLHVDWIRADMDGDGVDEFVPANDRPGPQAPDRAYNLFSTTTDTVPRSSRSNEQQHFFIGGSIYNGWTQVPDMYKVPDPPRPDPNKSAVNIFRFTW